MHPDPALVAIALIGSLAATIILIAALQTPLVFVFLAIIPSLSRLRRLRGRRRAS